LIITSSSSTPTSALLLLRLLLLSPFQPLTWSSSRSQYLKVTVHSEQAILLTPTPGRSLSQWQGQALSCNLAQFSPFITPSSLVVWIIEVKARLPPPSSGLEKIKKVIYLPFVFTWRVVPLDTAMMVVMSRDSGARKDENGSRGYGGI
jgi:hypothetical protein